MLVKNADFDRDEFIYEINALFEASDRAGQVLWRPVVDAEKPAPDAVMFFQNHSRLAVTFVEPICAVQGKKWKAMDSHGGVPIKDPITQAWNAGAAVREALKAHLGARTYVVSVVVFVNMDEDDDIINARGQRNVKIAWGTDDLVELLASLPEENELQPQLDADLIAKEVAALSRSLPDSYSEVAPTSSAPRPDGPNDLAGLDLGNRPVIMQHVNTVHIKIVVQGNGGSG